MLLRFGFGPALACSAILALAQGASAQTKVAIVNLQQAVFDCAEIKAADAEMQKKYKPKADEIEKLRTDALALNQKLETDAGKFTPQALNDMQTQLARMQRDFQRKKEDFDADLERERNEILSKSTEKMGEVIRKAAVEKGFDLIVDASTTLYFKDAMDITKDVVAAFDKAYPATAAPAAAPAAVPPAKPARK